MTPGEFLSSLAICVLGGLAGAALMFATLAAFAIWQRVRRDAKQNHRNKGQEL